MTNITGRFSADLLPNNTVEMQFSPDVGDAHQIGAKNIDDAESDFILLFGLSPNDAKEQVAELVDKKHIDFAAAAVSIDEAGLPVLIKEKSGTA